MSVWAIADLHLAISVPEKKMDDFGPPWQEYTQKIAARWQAVVQPDDLVLLPGDICWAMRVEEAQLDLEWIHALPGTKVMIRGNHDYWWTSLNKIEKILPPSIHLIQNNAYHWHDIGIAGSRLWDDLSEFTFKEVINYVPNPKAKKLTEEEWDPEEGERIFLRELNRLETSLKALKKDAKRRIVMTHYPPISVDVKESRVSKLLEKYHVDVCVFGHIHNVKKDQPLFGERNGIRYILVAADYIDFHPVKIF